MTPSEFAKIAALLKIYPYCMRTPEEKDAWYRTLKDYPYSPIEKAVQDYIATQEKQPVPASIIMMIPKSRKFDEYKPMYAEVDGKRQLLIQCQRCRDTGLIMFENERQELRGYACNCPAGRTLHPWAFLSREEQEAWAKKPENASCMCTDVGEIPHPE